MPSWKTKDARCQAPELQTANMASYPIEIPERLKRRNLTELIHDVRERSGAYTALDVVAAELGYAVMEEYGGTLAQESLVVRRGQVVGIPRGTHERLLRTLRRLIRISKAEMVEPRVPARGARQRS